jgi:DNA transformation protein
LASDPGFVAHVLDLVALVAPVTARAMFGGHGLYAEGVMFGLLDDGELFLKTDEETRARFVEAGCRRWVYVNEKVRMENTGYFRPPDEAHEDPEAMLPWARLALSAALRARAAKAAKQAGKAAPRKARPAAPRKSAKAPKAKTRAKAASASGARRPARRGAGAAKRTATRARPRRTR